VLLSIPFVFILFVLQSIPSEFFNSYDNILDIYLSCVVCNLLAIYSLDRFARCQSSKIGLTWMNDYKEFYFWIRSQT